MQRYCSELTEKLLKSIDKEYNVSTNLVSQRDLPRRLHVRTRKRLSGHSRSPVRRVAACTSSVRESISLVYVCIRVRITCDLYMCSVAAATTAIV